MPKHYKILIPIRIFAFTVGLSFWVLCIFLARATGNKKFQEWCVWRAYQVVKLVFNLRVTVKGEVAKARPLLMVSNHFTYLDVYVLGSLMPVHFTPKSDVGSWPIVGFLCRMGGCVFIDRRVSKTKDNQSELTQALQNGWIISLFPEGTTNDGTKIQPFRSSFFSLAEPPTNVPVQPVTVKYTHINGEPMQPKWLPLVGWYGDMTFGPHLLGVLSLLSISAEVEFHPQLNASGDRKALAAEAYDVINSSYSSSPEFHTS